MAIIVLYCIVVIRWSASLRDFMLFLYVWGGDIVRTRGDRQTPYPPDKRVTLRAAQSSRCTSLSSLFGGREFRNSSEFRKRSKGYDSQPFPSAVFSCLPTANLRRILLFQSSDRDSKDALCKFYCTSSFPIEQATSKLKVGLA